MELTWYQVFFASLAERIVIGALVLVHLLFMRLDQSWLRIGSIYIYTVIELVNGFTVSGAHQIIIEAD